MSVGKVCTREVIICRPDDTILQAARLMRDHHVGDVVIVDQKPDSVVPVGILTDRDIVVELLAQEVDLYSVTCADVMSSELTSVVEEDEILETIELMRSKGVRRVPVVNRQGGLEGIFAADDVVELVAEQLTDLVALFGRELKREQTSR